MTKIEKVDLKSKDIKSEQVERLKKIFPEIVADEKINFEQLKATLGEEIEDSKERFGMMWAGKSKCFRIIQDPSTGTLKPSREESVNFDTTQNIFIEGDNLEVLKLLQKSYYEKVKMVYIDPPYNTGNDFVYNDTFGQQLEEYLRITRQTDDEGKRLSTNTDSSGRYHSNWMNMMYPRLFLARNLLTEEGVICISIDDNEYDNLKKICNEIFGEENLVDIIIWKKRYQGAKERFHAAIHEYILIYAKNIIALQDFTISATEEYINRYFTNKDEKYSVRGGYRTQPLEAGKSMDTRKNLVYPIPAPDGTEVLPKRQWVWGKDRVYEALEKKELEFSKDKNGNWSIATKQYLKDENSKINRTKPTTIIDDIYTQHGTKESNDLLGDNVFSFPKPSKLIKRLLDVITGEQKNALILDFFAGSGTTAQAVLEINKEAGGNRKFICVQLPELLDESSDAHKAGYKTIADISKERIRKVIKKLEDDTKSSQKKLDDEVTAKLDLGFRVFKLDRSNFKKWDNQTQELQTSLSEHVEQIKSNANPEDVLYEILIKDGFELTTKIKKEQVKGKDIYLIESNLLLICLDEKLDLNLFKEMKKLNPHLVIVLDKGFKDNDQLKTNAVQTLGKNSDEEYILRSI